MYKNLMSYLLIFFITSCSIVSKPQIEQGNIITPEIVKELHPGMTPPQVVGMMGTPILANILSPNRIEYVYTIQDGKKTKTEMHVSCLFQNGRLKEIQRN